MLGLLTLGSTCVLGPNFFPLSLILGAATYVLGWIYLPDIPLFRRWVDRRHDAVRQAGHAAELAEFVRQRDAALARLSPSRRQRYQTLAGVCRDLEQAGAENSLTPENPASDPRLRRLDDLMWTYLRMLTIEESLDRFLEMERRENLPHLQAEAEAEVDRLSAEVEALKKNGVDRAMLETRERLLASRLERLEVLRKRRQRCEQTQANLDLVISEQERLDQQVKLIRADSVATRNTEAFSARIDATVQHLDQTNRWLAEMDEFKDLVGNLPATPERVGYDAQPAGASPASVAHHPPPLPVGGKRRT